MDEELKRIIAEDDRLRAARRAEEHHAEYKRRHAPAPVRIERKSLSYKVTDGSPFQDPDPMPVTTLPSSPIAEPAPLDVPDVPEPDGGSYTLPPAKPPNHGPSSPFTAPQDTDPGDDLASILDAMEAAITKLRAALASRGVTKSVSERVVKSMSPAQFQSYALGRFLDANSRKHKQHYGRIEALEREIAELKAARGNRKKR